MPYANPDAQRAYQREWKAQRRAEWFDGKSCVDCGSVEDLQLDHRDAATKVSHKIWSWSEERRLAELAKCVVRCRPCHVKKTKARGESPRGEAVGSAKLTAEQVVQIRRIQGETNRAIGDRFGVSEAQIRHIRSGRKWAHLSS